MYQYDKSQNDTYVDESIDKTTLIVNLDGGTSSVTYNEKYNKGAFVTLTNPTKDKYKFKGWELVSGKDAKLEGNTLTIGNNTTEVKAIWEIMQFGI